MTCSSTELCGQAGSSAAQGERYFRRKLALALWTCSSSRFKLAANFSASSNLHLFNSLASLASGTPSVMALSLSLVTRWGWRTSSIPPSTTRGLSWLGWGSTRWVAGDTASL